MFVCIYVFFFFFFFFFFKRARVLASTQMKVGEFPVFSTLSSKLLIRSKIILPLSVSL